MCTSQVRHWSKPISETGSSSTPTVRTRLEGGRNAHLRFQKKKTVLFGPTRDKAQYNDNLPLPSGKPLGGIRYRSTYKAARRTRKWVHHRREECCIEKNSAAEEFRERTILQIWTITSSRWHRRGSLSPGQKEEREIIAATKVIDHIPLEVCSFFLSFYAPNSLLLLLLSQYFLFLI